MLLSLPIEKWMARDTAMPAPTFFARPAWALALSAAYERLHPALLTVKVDGMTCVVPGVETAGGRLGWRTFVASPLGTYTYLADSEGEAADSVLAETVCASLARAFDVVEVTPWPLAPVHLSGAWTRYEHVAGVFDLKYNGSLLPHVKGVGRRMAGQAARRGLLCGRYDGEDSIDVYYALLREAAKHWGLPAPPYPKRLFEALRHYGGRDVEVWLARFEGEAVAGGVVLYGSQESFFWSAAMRRDFAFLRPSNALNLALIEAARERGVRWYNLGSSEGLPGVERFKRSLGAADVRYASFSRDRLLHSIYTRVLTPMKRRVIGAQR